MTANNTLWLCTSLTTHTQYLHTCSNMCIIVSIQTKKSRVVHLSRSHLRNRSMIWARHCQTLSLYQLYRSFRTFRALRSRLSSPLIFAIGEISPSQMFCLSQVSTGCTAIANFSNQIHAVGTRKSETNVGIGTRLVRRKSQGT